MQSFLVDRRTPFSFRENLKRYFCACLLSVTILTNFAFSPHVQAASSDNRREIQYVSEVLFNLLPQILIRMYLPFSPFLTSTFLMEPMGGEGTGIFLDFFRSFSGKTVSPPPENDSSFQKNGLEKFIPTTETDLTVWMLGSSATAFEKDFSDFERQFPYIHFDVVSFSTEDTYFSELNKAFQRRDPPDIFFVNTEWFHTLSKEEELLPAPSEIVTPDEIEKYFFPLATEFIRNGQVAAVPIFGKFPVMFSNKALLTDDRIFVASRPGKTWPELFTNLEKYQQFGNPEILPVGLGNPRFSPFTFDIFLLLLQQSGTQTFREQEARDALSFLLKFAQPFGRLMTAESDEEVFRTGKVAIIFGGKDTLLQLREDLRISDRNPRPGQLTSENLQLHLLPQFSADNPKTLGEVWGIAVSSEVSNPDFAWSLAVSLGTEEKAREHFLKTSETPLLTGIADDIFTESAALAVSAREWQRLDFRTFFVENVSTFFSSDEDVRPTVEEILANFTTFFSTTDE